jgi:hypothetical protein
MILFLINHSLLSYAGNLHGHPLGKDVIIVSKVGGAQGVTTSMSPIGNRDNGNLRHT